MPRPEQAAPQNRGVRLSVSRGVEVLRQCGLALAHVGFSVPMDYAFTIQEIAFAWVDNAPTYPDFGPLEAIAQVHVLDHQVRRDETSGLRLQFSLAVQSQLVATGGGLLRCFSRSQYDLLRRRNAAGVVVIRYDLNPIRRLTQRGNSLAGEVSWNHGDPFTFDHPHRSHSRHMRHKLGNTRRGNSHLRQCSLGCNGL